MNICVFHLENGENNVQTWSKNVGRFEAIPVEHVKLIVYFMPRRLVYTLGYETTVLV